MVFKNLKPANVVVTVIHDEDNDGELDVKWLLLPVEGTGVSNNIDGKFGPPDYDQCVITLSSGINEIQIRMRYHD